MNPPPLNFWLTNHLNVRYSSNPRLLINASQVRIFRMLPDKLTQNVRYRQLDSITANNPILSYRVRLIESVINSLTPPRPITDAYKASVYVLIGAMISEGDTLRYILRHGVEFDHLTACFRKTILYHPFDCCSECFSMPKCNVGQYLAKTKSDYLR